MKRIFDLFFSSLFLIILFPIFLLISLIVKLSSKGPVFFIQKRIGRYGQHFNMIKFRSMLNKLEDKNSVTCIGDYRITKFGKFLRKYKLDELPELVNVIIGDMSLVGPRPDVPGYADKLNNEDRLILNLRPGITGPATLKYSNEERILSLQKNPTKYNDEVIYPDKVKINLDYYYNNSIWLDIKIIFATVFRNNY
tara:strand:+ start:1805 stop:2389 length:585 start_codon:yes stop_codon:yes gene_type:complete